MAGNKLLLNDSKHTKRKEGCNSSNHHIRFDQVGDDIVTDNNTNHNLSSLSNDVTSTSPSPSSSTGVIQEGAPPNSNSKNNPRKNNKKRKRKHASSNTNQKREEAGGEKQIFNGLIVAISTLESKHNTKNDSKISSTKNSKNNDDDDDNNNDDSIDDSIDPYQNYKMLKAALQKLGATISPQVHKRVHYLISTDSAVQNLTQRVRQALKRNVDIVDVAWVKECSERKERVKVNDSAYLCNELVECLMVQKEREKKEKARKEEGGLYGDIMGNDGEEEQCVRVGDENLGWTTPVELDCCCVCHENGDDNCPWCTGCNLTLARLAKKK